jgi:hypothetical protein
MNYKEFYSWLEGYIDGKNGISVDKTDLEVIKSKMKTVSENQTPNINIGTIPKPVFKINSTSNSEPNY